MAAVHYPGTNVSAVKLQNIRAILLNLLYNEPAYRVKLARDISVSTTTVAKLVDELIELGLVEERAEEIEGRRSVGRPQNALYLVRNARFAIGVHIGGGIYRVGVVNLCNEIIHHRFGYFDLHAQAVDVLRAIADDIDQMLKECNICKDHIVGIGVGAPGLVNYKTGMIGYAKNQDWHSVPVGEWIGERLNMPVVVENNVRAMALGEAFFGAGREVSTLLFVYGRLGVAAGIVVDHQIYRGVSLGAGEIGHTFLFQEETGELQLGGRKTLEELVAAPALLARAKQLAQKYPAGVLAKTLQAADNLRNADAIFDAYRLGDPHACRLVDTSAHYLGLALVNVINFLNPELILLGGMFAQQKDIYLPIIERTTRELAFGDLAKRVVIKETGLGWRAGLLGASTLALTHFFYLSPEDLP